MKRNTRSHRISVVLVVVVCFAMTWAEDRIFAQCEVQWLSDPNGWSVHTDGQYAALGRWNGPDENHQVHVYRRKGVTLTEQAVLLSPNGDDSVHFGLEVHVNGEWLAVADPPLNEVYMYRRTEDGWSLEQTVKPPPGKGGRFGHSIAIDGDMMLIGAPWWGADGVTRIGTAHLYMFDGSSWEHEVELPNPDPHEGVPFTQPDHYGWSVALDGGRAVMGASTSKMTAGRAYVYEDDEDGWKFTLTLQPDPPDQYSAFGGTVQIAGNLVVATARLAPEHGRVYFFDLESGESTWIQGADYPIVLPSPIYENMKFGDAAAVSECGTRVMVGCMNDSEKDVFAGAAFLLKNHSGEWIMQQKLIGSTVTGGMSYGGAVSLAGDFALVGAINAVNPGHVHLYAGVLNEDCLGTGQPDACDIFEGNATDSSGNLVPDPCQADLNNDGVVDVFDLIILINEWGPCADCNDCPADLTGDCVVDVFDLIKLINNWG